MVKRFGDAPTFRPEKRRLAPDPGAPESPGVGYHGIDRGATGRADANRRKGFRGV